MGQLICRDCYDQHGLRYGNLELERQIDAAELQRLFPIDQCAARSIGKFVAQQSIEKLPQRCQAAYPVAFCQRNCSNRGTTK